MTHLLNKFKSVLLILLLVGTIGVGLTIPQNAQALNFSMSGIPSLLLNCTGASGSIGKILSKLTGSATSVSEVGIKDADKNYREECAKALGRYIAKQMLDKITQDTINWINTGFKGEPAYIKNPESLFKSIADKEIYAFTGLIGRNDVDFPFGLDTAESLINSYTRTFEQNAKFSLNEYVKTGNAKDFYTDFRTGGWGAWNAMITFPQNNATGFGLMSTDHIAKKTYDPTWGNDIQKVQQQVAQSGGFINQQKCVATMLGGAGTYVADDTFSEGEWEALAKTSTDPVPPGMNESDIMTARTHYCTRWETVTPGSVMSDQLNKALGTPLKSIEMADDLNKALASIFDALLKQLWEKGVSELTKLTDVNYTPSNSFGGVGSNSNVGGLSSNSEPWSTYGQTIDLYELLVTGQDTDDDLNTPNITLIDIQNAWIAKMIEVQDRLAEVITNLKKLDYWVPGPNANWMEGAGAAIEEAIRIALKPSVGQIIGEITDPSGLTTAIATGNRAAAAIGIEFIFNSYYASISRMYNPKYMLSDSLLYDKKTELENILIDTSQSLRKLPGYQDQRVQDLEELEIAISARNRLLDIKNKIENYYQAIQNSNDPYEIETIQKEIDRQVVIFKQLAPGLKSEEATQDLSVLPELYEDESAYLVDQKYEVIRKTLLWPVARRPYIDDEGDLLWNDPELKCWSPLRGPNTGSGFPIISGPPAFNNNPAGMMLAGYTPQGIIDEINQYYIDKFNPAPVPQFLQLQVTPQDIVAMAMSPRRGMHEYGNNSCSLLPIGYTEHDNETDNIWHQFPPIPNFKYRNDMDNGPIDLGDGFGQEAQNSNTHELNMYILKLDGSASANIQGYSYFEDKAGIY